MRTRDLSSFFFSFTGKIQFIFDFTVIESSVAVGSLFGSVGYFIVTLDIFTIFMWASDFVNKLRFVCGLRDFFFWFISHSISTVQWIILWAQQSYCASRLGFLDLRRRQWYEYCLHFSWQIIRIKYWTSTPFWYHVVFGELSSVFFSERGTDVCWFFFTFGRVISNFYSKCFLSKWHCITFSIEETYNFCKMSSNSVTNANSSRLLK